MRIAPFDRWGRPIDLAVALDGGQVFTWWPCGTDGHEGFRGLVEGRLVELSVDPSLPAGAVVAWGEGGSEAAAAVGRLLDLERDYRPLEQRLREREPRLAPLLSAVPGLRVVRLPPWEALLSFVLATHAPILRIKRMVAALVQRFGSAEQPFPPPQALAAADEAALRRLGLGYRARHVHALATRLAGEPDWPQRWAQLPTGPLRERLMQLPGVGRKVADCVLLFGFGRWDAFPIDRWVRRALQALYFDGQEVPLSKLHRWADQRFGELGGLAQAYLFATWRVVRACGGPDAVAGSGAHRGRDGPCP